MNIRIRKIILSVCFLIMVMSTAIAPVMAVKDLAITDSRLQYITRTDVWQNYNGHTLLKYSEPGLKVNQKSIGLGPKHCIAINGKKICKYKFHGYQVCNVKNTHCGYCTDFVQSCSGSKLTTKDWIRGTNVINGDIFPGTVIATFNKNGKYESGTGLHSAVFYQYLIEGNKKGIEVIDQSFYPGLDVVAKHKIYDTGTNNSDADNYYVVQVPS